MNDYWSSFNAYIANVTIPRKFAVWAMLHTVSTALGQRMHFNYSGWTIPLNLFTLFIAESGRGKSVTLNVASDLLKPLNLHTINGSCTYTSFITETIKHVPRIINKGNVVSHNHSAAIHASECSTLLNAKNKNLIQLLCDCYDGNRDVSSTTIDRDTETLKKPYITLLGCGTLEWFQNEISKSTFSDGFLRRSLIIFTEERLPINVDFNNKKDSNPVFYECIMFLESIASSTYCDIEISAEAAAVFTDYIKMRKPARIKRLEAFVDNLHIQIVKVACLFELCHKSIDDLNNLNRSKSLSISKFSMLMAVDLLIQTERDLISFFDPIGKMTLEQIIQTHAHSRIKASPNVFTFEQIVKTLTSIDRTPDELTRQVLIRMLESELHTNENGTIRFK